MERNRLVEHLVCGRNLSRQLADAMKIDFERVHWKLWAREYPEKVLETLTVHIQPVSWGEAGVNLEQSTAFWNAVHEILGSKMGWISVGYSDRVLLDHWDSMPGYEHETLAQGGPYGPIEWRTESHIS